MELFRRWPAVLGFLAAVFLTYSLGRSLRAYYRLKAFKGPWLTGFSKLWLLRAQLTGECHLHLARANEEYGSLARIGPNQLVTNDPEVLRVINGTNSPFKRSDWFEALKFDGVRNNVLSQRDIEKHKILRAKLAKGYSGKEIDGLEERIDACIHQMVALINRKYLSKGSSLRAVDLCRIAQYFALDVITDLGFGQALGYLQNDTDVYEYIKTTEAALPFILVTNTLPSLLRFMHVTGILNAVSPKKTDKIGLGRFMRHCGEDVASRLASVKDFGQDMLGSFLRHGLEPDEAEAEILLQVMAGSDTTATAVRSTMLQLITHPVVYIRLRADIDQAIKEDRISTPISDAEARRLPYLQAVIREGLRTHPPITGLMLKEAPPEGILIKDTWIPGSTQIGYCAWGTQQRPEVFGEDAKAFRPERWLEADEESLLQMERLNDMVFGYGRFMCLGKDIARIELSKVFVELLRRYDFSLVDPTRPPWKSYNVGIFTQKNMFVRISERDSL